MSSQSMDDPDDFDPYHKWLGIPLNKRPPTYYQILGISPSETDSETITAAADRHESFIKQFRGGPLASHVSTILFQVEQARMTLLDRAAREKYDHSLKIARKRRRRNLFGTEEIPAVATGSNSIGEDSGLAGQFFGIMALVAGGMLAIYLLAVYVPWRALKNDPQAAQVDSAPDQPLAETQVADASGSTPPNAGPGADKQPATQRADPKPPDAKPTGGVANDAELIAFFKSVIGSQRKSGEAFNRVSSLLDECVHNDVAEIGPLEAA